ncbi:Ig-like domain-containing protein [Macrococcoides canis]|uniref:Ig-like domain-containing protein n=1 Tax=Macrococcoides canis TaxID=1855823 RepID=UPI00165DECE2|nr:Ig-like domain-containing protein [Macrococcus canis]QNR07204.1 hypothetical protein GL258_02720 [Macrococcus canis]
MSLLLVSMSVGVSNSDAMMTSAEEQAYADNSIKNKLVLKDQSTNSEIGKVTITGDIFDSRLNDYINKINEENNTYFIIASKELEKTLKYTSSFNGYSVTETERKYTIYLKNNSIEPFTGIKPKFIPEGVLYDDSDAQYQMFDIHVISNNHEYFTNKYVAYQSTDEAIRAAMQHIESDKFYYDDVKVENGFIMYNDGVTKYSGNFKNIKIYLKEYSNWGKVEPSIEQPTTEQPTTERPTTEQPTTERPTTEVSTTEVPTTEHPTTELPTTERPTTERPVVKPPVKPVVVKTPTLNEKSVTDKSTSISGVSNSNGTVYVLSNNKVIGKANVVNGKFKVNFKPVKAGSTLTIYTELNKLKSKPITIKVKKAPIKKITVATLVINQKYISNKTTSISGSSKSNGTVYVLANNKVIGKANVSKGKFKVKFKAVAAGKNVSVYTVQNKVKSKYVNFKVVDKIAPKPPVVNKVTTKSIKVTGSGEKYAQVTVYKGKTLIAKSAVNNRGKFALKINKQKKNTVLNVYLTDKSKNKSKAKSIKVS